MRTIAIVILVFLIVLTGSAFAADGPNTGPNKVSINEDHVLVINGKKIFPIAFTMPPPPDGKAPSGKPAYEELRSAGGTMMRTGPGGEQGWNDAWVAQEKAYHEAAAKAGMYCLPWLKELSAVDAGNKKEEARLREIIQMFKDSPALACWKGEDEPQWGEMNSRGKKTPAPLINSYKIIKEEDQDHPVWIVQAPRGTIEQLKPYNVTYDITGVDVYPISYPPGKHSQLPNHDISMVGDYTQKMLAVVDHKQPVWLTLQICWSGVSGKNTLRFPTFPEERFMAYQAIINGARGEVFFGGNVKDGWTAEDAKLGWNWHFWNEVLRPVVEEIGDKGQIYDVLIAPDSKIKLKADGEGIEHLVRETDNAIYVLACSRDPKKTQEINFTGLPAGATTAEVVYEAPRKIIAKDGKFKDWFAPYDVHVYKFAR